MQLFIISFCSVTAGDGVLAQPHIFPFSKQWLQLLASFSEIDAICGLCACTEKPLGLSLRKLQKEGRKMPACNLITVIREISKISPTTVARL